MTNKKKTAKSLWIRANDKYANRNIDELESSIRSKFERDRDRILYSKSFRRLNGKTQIFLSRQSAHFRNRLTHTLEVNQIAKAISKELQMNNGLTEAIALGHDLGHTPFGHVGERTLHKIIAGKHDKIPIAEPSSFKHNLNGLYIVEKFEKKNRKYKGLNLTDHTKYGIVHHSNLIYKKESDPKLYTYYNDLVSTCISDDSWSVESVIVSIADEIAQRHHDIEDGFFSKIISREEVLELIQENLSSFFSNYHKKLFNEAKTEYTDNYFISIISSLLVDLFVKNIIDNSKNNILDFIRSKNISSNKDFVQIKKEIDIIEVDLVGYSPELQKAETAVQKFLKNRILNSYEVQSLDGKSEYIIVRLFKAYQTNPQQLPNGILIDLISELDQKEPEKDSDPHTFGVIRERLRSEANDSKLASLLLRHIVNFISTMTDDYAYQEFDKLYGTRID